MTKVKVDPGPCGFKAVITAQQNDDEMIDVTVGCGCEAIQKMMEAVGTELDPYEVCLVKPGNGPFYEFASSSPDFPVHASCPVLNAIGKAVEVEAGLALVHNVTIEFFE